MHHLLTVLLLLFLLACPVSARAASAGEAVFFYLGSTDGEEAAVYDDYAWYLNSVASHLENLGVVVSYHTRAPFQTKIEQLKTPLSFDRADLRLDLGFILVEPDRSYKIYYGVHTDVEIMQLARDNFSLQGE